MLSVIKAILHLLHGIVYVEVDENGLTVERFSGYRAVLLSVIFLSLISNAWLFTRYINISNYAYDLKAQIEKKCPKPEDTKKAEVKKP